jgi:NTE family protein
MRALVLSGGGLFGAWQVGAWSVLAPEWKPDLIVGASIGALNGYLLASGVGPEELTRMWREPQFRRLGDLHANLRAMTARFRLRQPFALTVTEWRGLRPRIYRDGDITWRHLAASCAVPPFLPQVRLRGRWCTDGGVLAALPVWAAAELGATEAIGLHALARFPVSWMEPLVEGFRALFRERVAVRGPIRVRVLGPGERLGGLRDTLWAGQGEVERWIQLGAQDGRRFLTEKSFP